MEQTTYWNNQERDCVVVGKPFNYIRSSSSQGGAIPWPWVSKVSECSKALFLSLFHRACSLGVAAVSRGGGREESAQNGPGLTAIYIHFAGRNERSRIRTIGGRSRWRIFTRKMIRSYKIFLLPVINYHVYSWVWTSSCVYHLHLVVQNPQVSFVLHSFACSALDFFGRVAQISALLNWPSLKCFPFHSELKNALFWHWRVRSTER